MRAIRELQETKEAVEEKDEIIHRYESINSSDNWQVNPENLMLASKSKTLKLSTYLGVQVDFRIRLTLKTILNNLKQS